MTSSSSLYGTVTTQNSSSSNSTSLYGEAGTPIPDSSGNVIVRGDLYVLSGNILTTAQTGNIFPANATTINLGNAATTVNIGAGTGTTTINNDLTVGGTGTFAGDITATGADFGNITIGFIDDNTISTTTDNLVLTSATGNLQFYNNTGFLYSEANNPGNRPYFQSVNGNSSGLRVVAPNTSTSAVATISALNSSDTTNAKLIALQSRGSASDPLRIFTAKYTGGVQGATNQSIAFTDYTNTYATVNPAGPTIGTDLATKAYVDAQELNTTYTIDASTTTGGANFNLVGSDATTDTIKFASGTGVTVSRTDANTITTSIGQSVATTAEPTFAGATLGNITVGVATNNTITTSANNLVLKSATGEIDTDTTTILSTNSSNFNLLNSPTTVSAFQGATSLVIGGATGTTEIRNALNVSEIYHPNPLTLSGGNFQPTSLVLDDVSSITTLDGGTGEDVAVLTATNGSLTWAHTASPFSIGSVSGTWSYNIDGTTSFPNYKFPYADGTANQVLKTNGSGVLSWYTPTDVNTTYNIDASSTTGGANLNLNGSDSTVDPVAFKGSGATTVTRTDANTITISSTDTNTTYDFNATSTTGGANLNLVGSDSTTDTVKLTNGGHITATYTSGTVVTLGSDATDANTAGAIVARDGSGNFSASGATLGNVTVGVDTDQVVSTTSGNLILQTAAGVNAGTITLAAGSNGNITLAPNGTGVVSSGVTQLANGSRTLGAHYGTQSTTWTPPSSGLTTITGTNGFAASSSSGGANGYNSSISSTYYSGDTTAGTNTSAAIIGRGATGTNSSPTALASGQVLLTLNADGYGTNGWAGTIATANSGAGTSVIAPAQLQFYSREAFADTGTSVTAAGTGMRVRLFNAATAMTAANRVSIIDHTTTAATYKAVTFNIQPAASTANYATFGATTGSINQDTLTLKNNAATTTYATFNSTSAAINGTTTNINNTAGTTTYASFAAGGSSIGYVDATVLLDRTTAGTPGVANQKNAFTIESRRSDQAGVTNTDTTGNAFRVGGTGNYYWTNQIQSQYLTSGDHIYTIQAAAGDQTSGSPSYLNLATFAPTQTIFRAGTAGSGGSTATKLTVDANKITAAVPVAFPVYTAAAANAITGAVGWQISISNSPTVGGRMAFWDTTNARWSYISDNSAV